MKANCETCPNNDDGTGCDGLINYWLGVALLTPDERKKAEDDLGKVCKEARGEAS